MKKWLLTLLAIPVLLMGCGDEEQQLQDSGVPQMVDVKIITPTQLAVSEEIELAVHVSQGGKDIDDADSVKFEVWESGLRDAGELLDGEYDKDGVYKVNYTFDHAGIYYMFAHTTAHGLHVMPKIELTVGTPDKSKVLPDESSSDMDGMEDTDENSENQDEKTTSH